jgi:hypothetical protein
MLPCARPRRRTAQGSPAMASRQQCQAIGRAEESAKFQDTSISLSPPEMEANSKRVRIPGCATAERRTDLSTSNEFGIRFCCPRSATPSVHCFSRNPTFREAAAPRHEDDLMTAVAVVRPMAPAGPPRHKTRPGAPRSKDQTPTAQQSQRQQIVVHKTDVADEEKLPHRPNPGRRATT